jgi:hypothetical protein
MIGLSLPMRFGGLKNKVSVHRFKVHGSQLVVVVRHSKLANTNGRPEIQSNPEPSISEPVKDSRNFE